MAETTITDLPLASGIDAAADWFAIDRTSLGTTQRINRNTILGISGAPVGTTDSQTLTNKVITSPTLTVLDNALTIQDNSDPTKQAQFQLSSITAGQTRTYTLPDASTTIVGTGTTQTLTNKTLTAPTINGGTIVGSTVEVDAIVGDAVANTGTIYGASITSGVIDSAALLNSVNTSAIQDLAVTSAKLGASSVTPEKLLTGTGTTWGWQSWVASWTNLSVGNGTVVSIYSQTGKTVTAQLTLIWGNTTSASGVTIFSLPVTASANSSSTSNAVGVSIMRDSNTTNKLNGAVQLTSTTTAQVFVNNSISSVGTVQTTVPWTWATGDSLAVSFTYEAA